MGQTIRLNNSFKSLNARYATKRLKVTTIIQTLYTNPVYYTYHIFPHFKLNIVKGHDHFGHCMKSHPAHLKVNDALSPASYQHSGGQLNTERNVHYELTQVKQIDLQLARTQLRHASDNQLQETEEQTPGSPFHSYYYSFVLITQEPKWSMVLRIKTRIYILSFFIDLYTEF